MSGHSKWSQIKHKKTVTDAKRGQLFSKMVKEITVAARSGGTSAETNPRLRQALERAKFAGLPKENRERAVLKASGGEEGTLLQEFLYEATYPGGIMILVKGISDNKNRTLAEIKHLLGGHGAKLANPDSLVWNFDKTGVIAIALGDNHHMKSDELELAIIEAGARDFKKTNTALLVEVDFEKREEVRKKLEEWGVKIKESYYDYKPRAPISLPEKERKVAEGLLGAISDHNDVQGVYTNLKE